MSVALFNWQKKHVLSKPCEQDTNKTCEQDTNKTCEQDTNKTFNSEFRTQNKIKQNLLYNCNIMVSLILNISKQPSNRVHSIALFRTCMGNYTTKIFKIIFFVEGSSTISL